MSNNIVYRYKKELTDIVGNKVFAFRAFDKFNKNKENKNFVVIGHPKAMSEYSLEKLEEFLKNNVDSRFTT